MSRDTLYTLKKLLAEYTIEVPAIQRDYAFGRKGQIDKRINFVSSIRDALLAKKPKLHLDFIYGKKDEKGRLVLLDGQQRITTLWLVAVYLIKIEKIINSNSLLRDEEVIYKKLNNFSYDTRISSREFCRALVEKEWSSSNWIYPLNKEVEEKTYLNEKWFFHSWRNDPTVTGMVEMLKSIHTYLFEDVKKNNICIDSIGNITFSFLDIEEIGQPEELYLKMNSRGKQLSDWDNFKAELFEYIENTDIRNKEKLKKQIDIDLIELFWNINRDNNPEKTTEHSLLKLFKNAIKVEAILKEDINAKDYNDNKVNELVNRSWKNLIDLTALQRFWLFLRDESEEIEAIKFSRFEISGIEIKELYKSLIGSSSWQMTADNLALFSTYYLFIKYRYNTDNYNIDDLQQAVRLVSNYIGRNLRSDFDNNSRNIHRINGILSNTNKTVLESVLDFKDEEYDKAKLMLDDDSWSELIYTVEKNELTKGSVKWLLNISKDSLGNYSLPKANMNYEKLFESENSIFLNYGIKDKESEAILLSYFDIRKGDKFPDGKNAHSEVYSWWSYFRDANGDDTANGLLNLIENSFSPNLELSSSSWEQWYLAVPKLFDFLTLKLSYWETNKDFLIRGQKRGGSKKKLLQLEALKMFSPDLKIETITSTNRLDDFFGYIGDTKDSYTVRIEYLDDHYILKLADGTKIDQESETRPIDKLNVITTKIKNLI